MTDQPKTNHSNILYSRKYVVWLVKVKKFCKQNEFLNIWFNVCQSQWQTTNVTHWPSELASSITFNNANLCVSYSCSRTLFSSWGAMSHLYSIREGKKEEKEKHYNLDKAMPALWQKMKIRPFVRWWMNLLISETLLAPPENSATEQWTLC